MQAQQAIVAQASTPNPLTKLYTDMITKKLAFYNQGAPNYDTNQTDKTGQPLDPGGPVFADAATREARAKRDSDRTGTGAIQMGSYGADPGQLAQLKESRIRHESEDASLDAADAVNQDRAFTFGQVLPLSGDANQRLSVASGAAGNAANSATNVYQSYPKQQSWWQTALQGGALAAQLGAHI